MFFLLLLLASLTCAVEGQTLSFFKRTSEHAGYTAVAADASGVYAFSRTAVRKYDSRGNELWTRPFSSPTYVSWAAADTAGVYAHVYIESSRQFLVRKYSANGVELWAREVVFPGGVGADATGVYVAQRDRAPGMFTVLRKYSPDGAELWMKQLGDIEPWPAGLVADTAGIYVLAATAGTGMIVRKLDRSGNELWTRQFSPGGVLRGFGGAEGAGFYAIVSLPEEGWAPSLRKYDSGGNQLWARTIDIGDVYAKIAGDATGVYIAGKVPVQYPPYTLSPALPGQCSSGGGGDSFVRKYSAAGEELWTRQFGTSQAAWASAMAIDGGGVYVVGEEGAAQVRDDLEHFDAFAPAKPTRAAFLAKFEKTAAVVAPGPRIFPDCVVNAASYVGGGVAPGEIVTIFGSVIGPADLAPFRVGENRRLATTLAETRILFNGTAAALLYVSDKQSSAIVPYDVAARSSVDIQVEYKGVRSDAVTVPVLPSRPGIFTADGSGKGPGAILNEDGSLNSPSNPARRGSIVTLFATGGGEAAPGILDGQILTDVLPRTSLPVSILFDLGSSEFQVPPKPAEVLYAGAVSGSVTGLLQLSVRVPVNAVATGPTVPFMLIIGSEWTVHRATISLR